MKEPELEIPIVEKFTMFRCPVHKKLVEMGESCVICYRDISYYESMGYSLEKMLCEVSQAELLGMFE